LTLDILYLAKPPLFELVRTGRKNSVYIYDEDDLEIEIDKAIVET
jgi:DNA gyrase/topoisomerase IV subunit B